MSDILGETASLCPVCLERVHARKVSEHGNVYLEKTCAQHGEYRALIWRGADSYERWGASGVDLGSPAVRLTASREGCPYDCGLCPAHKAETCVAIMEVTLECNLRCPVCFASAGERDGDTPALEDIRAVYKTILRSAGPSCPVQLSGGEPTVRDDLPRIVAMGKEMGFNHIQVNTNGLRISEDIEYLRALKAAGASIIYLQFDGLTDDVYVRMRGRGMFSVKLKAIENCAEVGIGVLLVPVLVPGVNLHQVGDMMRLAKSWVPVVKGLHLQPISYFGRYPSCPDDDVRLTIPDVLAAIEEQTGGEMKSLDFAPRRRKESYCAFGGLFVLNEEDELVAMTRFDRPPDGLGGMGQMKKQPYEQARHYVTQKWRYVETPQGRVEARPGSWQSFFERARTHYLSVTCMPFQDIWNLDLDRLTRCCTHVAAWDGRVVPFCAYYVTSSDGVRLTDEARRRQHVS